MPLLSQKPRPGEEVQDLPATVKFIISIYRKDHFSALLDLIHIIITVPVASADSPLHMSVGMLIQSEYILKTSLSMK